MHDADFQSSRFGRIYLRRADSLKVRSEHIANHLQPLQVWRIQLLRVSLFASHRMQSDAPRLLPEKSIFLLQAAPPRLGSHLVIFYLELHSKPERHDFYDSRSR